jgi:hypothetical protein
MATSAMTDTKGYLADVPQEYVFWCCDGRILKNLRELCDALGAMSDDTFACHVNAANTATAVRAVTDRITFLSKKPRAAAAKKVTRRKTTRR